MKTKTTNFFAALSGTAIVLSVIAIAMSVSEDTVINDISLVLGFIGVLATFIVVTNYVQVGKLEHDLATQTKMLDDTICKVNEQNHRLYTMSKRIIYTTVDTVIIKEIDRAFLYMGDILPILTELYGEDGKGIDYDDENLQMALQTISRILQQHKENIKEGKKCITLETLKAFQSDMKQYLPEKYNHIPEIQDISNELDTLIRNYQQE